MDPIEVQLKMQALQFSVENNKDSIQKIETFIQTSIQNQNTELDSLKESIKDINFRLSKNFLSFESLAKRILFLASIVGALQIVFRYLSGFFK